MTRENDLKLVSQCLLLKFYWNIATFICLHIIYGYVHTTMAELSYCDRELQSLKYLLPGQKKNVLIPVSVFVFICLNNKNSGNFLDIISTGFFKDFLFLYHNQYSKSKTFQMYPFYYSAQ